MLTVKNSERFAFIDCEPKKGKIEVDFYKGFFDGVIVKSSEMVEIKHIKYVADSLRYVKIDNEEIFLFVSNPTHKKDTRKGIEFFVYEHPFSSANKMFFEHFCIVKGEILYKGLYDLNLNDIYINLYNRKEKSFRLHKVNWMEAEKTGLYEALYENGLLRWLIDLENCKKIFTVYYQKV